MSQTVGKSLASIFLTLAMLLCGQSLSAQDAPVAQPETYKFELGAGLGMTGYLGDLNESSLFSHPGFGGNISFRYLANTRWVIRALLNVVSLSGTTDGMDNVLPDTPDYSFNSTVYDLQGRFEFNFFNYGMGERYKKLKRFTPYVALGVGMSLASTGDGTYVAASIPIAVGVKYKLKERWNLGLEFSMTKLLGDHADSGQLSDLYHIKSSFVKNTDWYSAITISVSYEFAKRCVACNRQD